MKTPEEFENFLKLLNFDIDDFCFPYSKSTIRSFSNNNILKLSDLIKIKEFLQVDDLEIDPMNHTIVYVTK